jgi:hypothetical protein
MTPKTMAKPMTKSESSGPVETQRLGETSSRQGVNLTATKRIDSPHEVGDAASELAAALPTLAAESTNDEPATEQIRLQADQLASHLRGRQKELDYREAELNARIAKFESDARVARLWTGERETDLASCAEQLAKQQQELAMRSEALAARAEQIASQQQEVSRRREAVASLEREAVLGQQEVEKRLARLAAADAAQQKHASLSTTQHEEELHRLAETLATRKKRIDDAEARLAQAQAETQELQAQLSDRRKAFAEETAAMRQRMAAEQAQATADLEQKRQAVQRRADHVDHCRAALKQLRGELGRMHRETLEIRLVTEELWVQLSVAAPPAALTQSLGRIRTKLAEQYHQANAELADQRKELEAIRGQLVQQHETLVEQKRRFEQWAAGREEQCQQQASRLVAREQQLHQEEIQRREQSQNWQRERIAYQQELRRLRTERKEAAVPA